MGYRDRFKALDDLIPHMDTFVPSLADPLLKAQYTGLLIIAGVTAYELGIKDIFYGFSDKKHPILGNATRNRFEKLNGRIMIADLQGIQINFFGDKYKIKFKNHLKAHRDEYLKTHKADIVSSYNNLIIWRHDAVHKNIIPATYEEAKTAYYHGQEILHCLYSVMRR